MMPIHNCQMGNTRLPSGHFFFCPLSNANLVNNLRHDKASSGDNGNLSGANTNRMFDFQMGR